MKILNAIFSQNIGGVNQVFKDYSDVLSGLGHEVSLLVSDNKKCCYRDVPKNEIFVLKNISPVFDLIHLFWVVLKFRPDVIICHSGRITKLIKILKNVCSFKVINVNHGTTVKYSLNCDCAISVNEKLAQLVIKAGLETEKSCVVSNAIKIDEKYFLKGIGDEILVGGFGRIERAKGFDVMIKALKIMVDEGVKIRMKIGGFEVKESGYGFDNLRNLAKSLKVSDKVEFVGLVENKKSFFADLDISKKKEHVPVKTK